MRANKILLGSASSMVNMWKVRLDSRCFLVTPAHVAVFAKGVDPVWTSSPYLQQFKCLDWKIPAKYLALQSGAYDIAYAECDESVDALALDIHEVKAPEKGTVFFRQPLGENAEMRVNDPAFRAEEVTLYKASEGSRLLEAFHVGFRGQSGAGVFAENSTDLLGICVRRGILLKAKHTAVEDVPPTASPLGKFLQSLLGLDRIAADGAEIKSNMVRRDDLWEVSTSFNFRRGLFLPASSFEPLMVHEPSVHIKEMEGKKAEVIRF